MRGADYFARRDPALDAITSESVPYPGVLTVLREKGGREAIARWREMRDRFEQIEWWQPWRWQDLNSLSYDLLAAGRTEDAIAGFLINTERNPAMWEPWDSLGEAYLKAGLRADALASYSRALEIDPRNWNAAEQKRIIDALRAGRNP
jgi:tetratricopeptide (TPR) repeat protein